MKRVRINQDFQKRVLDIDFLEIEVIKQLEELNDLYIHDEEIESTIEKFWKAEDGLESCDLFPEIVEKYHDFLRE